MADPTGQPCNIGADCPDGYACDIPTHTCMPQGVAVTNIVPAPDDATEQTWIGQIKAKFRAMILDWRETRIAYNTMVSERGTFGVPVIDSGWTKAQDDTYQLMDYIVHTLAGYLGEVDEGIRKVAYDTYGDQVVMLGDSGDIELSAKDGVLSMKVGDKSANVDPAGFVGIAWPVVVVIVAGAALQVVLIVQISTAIRDYIKRLIQKDALDHEQKSAEDKIKGGMNPGKAHETSTAETNSTIKALGDKARADAEAEDKGGTAQIASVIKTVAWVGLGIVVIGGLFYVGAPLLQRAMLESRGGGVPQLARQNPSPGGRRRILGTTGDVNMFDFDAGVVYSDEYGTQWEWWEWDNENDESSSAKATVYRADLADDIFADHNWANIDSVASTIAADPDELRRAGKSRSAMERQYALEAIVLNYGSFELDQYPLHLTRSELKKRWGRVDPRKVRKNPSKPQPIEGYAYNTNRKSWRDSPDDSWDNVMIDNDDGPFEYKGIRHIDGSLVNVWSAGKGKTFRYYAQLEHMTRGA